MARAAKVITAAAMSALVLAGCEIDVPAIASGDAAMSEAGRVVRTWQLEGNQVREVSLWLNQHKDGWSRNFVTPSAQVSVKLVATDGTPLGLYILSNQVLINYRGTQMSQTFPAAKVVALRTAVGAVTK
jgi:hypothetical protein